MAEVGTDMEALRKALFIVELLLGPGLATFLLLPIAMIGFLAFGLSLTGIFMPGSDLPSFMFGVFLLPFFLMAMGGLLGLPGLWAAVLTSGPIPERQRKLLLASLVLGVLSAGTFLTFMVWGSIEGGTRDLPGTLWLGLGFLFPVLIGARHIVRLIFLGRGA
ncbi:MAG: hypothetical protein P8Y29_11875 [Gemmatimonadota bacterium]|jgi:hypothetical protein